MAKLTHARLLCKMEAPSLPIQAASRGEESEGTSGANSDPGRGNHAAAEPTATGAEALPASPAAGGAQARLRAGMIPRTVAACGVCGVGGAQVSGVRGGASRSSCGCPAACDGRVGSSQAAAAACARGTRGGIGGAPRPRVWMHNNFPNP